MGITLFTLVAIPLMDGKGEAQLLGWHCPIAAIIGVKGTVS